MLPWIQKIRKDKKTAVTILITSAVVFIFLFSFFVAFGSEVQAQGDDTLGVAEIEQGSLILAGTDIRVVIVKIIRAALALLGIVTVSLIIYAGFTIMTAGGNEEQIIKGRKTIMNAVIGLIIILSAFVIVQFIINALTGNLEQVPRGEQPPGLVSYFGSGSLGQIVKDHYPERNQRDVYRNTPIVVTFKDPIDPSSLIINSNNTCWGEDNLPTEDCEIDDAGFIINPYYGDCTENGVCDQLVTSSVKIFISTSTPYARLIDEDFNLPDNYFISATAETSYNQDRQATTFYFKPLEFLGNPAFPVWYTVRLTDQILRLQTNNDLQISAFPEGSDGYYAWDFETGTELDLEPPYVVSVIPRRDGIADRNDSIKIEFNEAINPISAQGYFSSTSPFYSLVIDSASTTMEIRGEWILSNGYKTVEFISDLSCGTTNSCGDEMFCLPIDCEETDLECSTNYKVLIRTARLKNVGNPNSEMPFEGDSMTGIVDMVGNALDGDRDSIPDGRPMDPVTFGNKHRFINTGDEGFREDRPDNDFWYFVLRNHIDKESPFIKIVEPDIDTDGIAEDENIELDFSKTMFSHTLYDIGLEEYPCYDGRSVCNVAHSPRSRDIKGEIADDDYTHVKINHFDWLFGANDQDLYYFPIVSSSLLSSDWNCFYPGFGPDENKDGEECLVEYDEAGNISEIQNCVDVNFNPSTDSGCIQTTLPRRGDEYLLLQPENNTCLGIQQSDEISPVD